MSRSEATGHEHLTFDRWVQAEFARTRGFTALVILVRIQGLSITPLRSSFFHVVGDEIGWAEAARLLSGAGVAWDGVLFASVWNERDGGPVIELVARSELDDLAARLAADRTELNRNHFFDPWGRRMEVEEVTPQ